MESNMLVIRDFCEADISQLAILANNSKITDNVRDSMPYPYYRDDAISFIEYCREEDPQVTFAIEYKGCFVGCVGLVLQTDIYRLNAEIGYWIGEPFWGKGIATEAVKLASDYAFKKLNLNRLYAGVFESNAASQRVLEKAGFKKDCLLEQSVIKNNVVLNEVRFSLLK